jgi:glycosyltransferase involved in cell wall biosynthesis
MAHPPEISVVLPTHDRPAFLADAIASVRAQTVESWQLVVVDNGSDAPATVPDDDRIHLVRLCENRGPARARNVGVAKAAADAVDFLDDDDRFTPERLALALRGLETSPVAVCSARFLGEAPGRLRRLQGDVSDTILDDLTPSLGATAVRRHSFVPFNERWMALEDVDWWWRMAQRHPVVTIDAIGYLVRRHDGPRPTNDISVRLRENLEFLEEHKRWFADHRRARGFRLRRAAAMASSVGDRAFARRLLVRSWYAHPSPRTAWQLRGNLGSG